MRVSAHCYVRTYTICGTGSTFAIVRCRNLKKNALNYAIIKYPAYGNHSYFSKWPEAAAIPSKEATCVASFLLEIFCRHGWPKIVLFDQGREFVNQINSSLFERTGVQHCVSSAYHPETNGRLNQTLVATLKKVVDVCSNNDWDEHISAALYAYRISKQASSKFSPFCITASLEKL